ncbi:MAG: TetR/AcrR family transcriptional regulator [Bacillota bacterium]
MPQILKQAVKEKILQSALASFLEKGFRNASMQEIAMGAGIAAGNIYHYFRNKEEVFSTLITPVLAEIKALFGLRVSDLPRMSAQEKADISGKKMEAFIKVYQKNRKVFVMLFEKSGSTKFETTKADVIESLSAAILRAKYSFTLSAATREQEILVKAFAAAFINGIISILTERIDEGLKLRALKQFLPFMRTKLILALR